MNPSHIAVDDDEPEKQINSRTLPTSGKEMHSVINLYRPGGHKQGRTGNLSDMKYIIFTEIPESQLLDVLNDQQKMSKCDAIAFMYDNDKDHLDFIRDYINKFP